MDLWLKFAKAKFRKNVEARTTFKKDSGKTTGTAVHDENLKYAQRCAARNRDRKSHKNCEYWKIIFEKKGGLRKDGSWHVLLSGDKGGKIMSMKSTKKVRPNIKDIARKMCVQ